MIIDPPHAFISFYVTTTLDATTSSPKQFCLEIRILGRKKDADTFKSTDFCTENLEFRMDKVPVIRRN